MNCICEQSHLKPVCEPVQSSFSLLLFACKFLKSLYTEPQLRGGIEDNSKRIVLISQKHTL